MKRYKWFHVTLPLRLSQLSNRLVRFPFVTDKDSGFLHISGALGRVRFRYFRRTKVVVSVVDEAGIPSAQVIDSVESFEFELFELGEAFLIRVDEPPRSIKSLLDSLEQVCGNGLSVSLVTFPFERHELILAGQRSCKLVALKGTGADRRRRYVARVEVASREGIVFEQLSVLRGLDFSIDSSTYEVINELGRGQVSFSGSGIVRFGDQVAESLLEAVERYLQKSGLEVGRGINEKAD